MKNNFEKLTGMASKSYHGNMTEDNSEIKKNLPRDKEGVEGGKTPVKPVENINAVGKPGGKEIDKMTSEKSREAFNWKNLTEVEKQEYFEKMEKMTQESEKGKEPGLFDILMDILKAWFGVEDDEKAKDIIKNSEAMRGISAYLRIKPQNKWGATDYMRVFCMLAPDTSEASIRLKSKLESDAKENGIKTDDMNNAGTRISQEHPEFFSKKDEARNGPERRAEMMHRSVVMNTDLREETAEKEKKFQTKLKEVKDKFKIFDLENQKKVRAAIESGDMYFFSKLLNLFGEYGTDPEVLRSAGVSYLKAYKFNEEHGLEISENAKQVAGLMKDALPGLGVDESSIYNRSEENEVREKTKKAISKKNEQKSKDEEVEEGGKARKKGSESGKEAEAEIKTKIEKKREEDRDKILRKIEENTRKRVEQGEITIDQMADMLDVAVRTLDQLGIITARLDELTSILSEGLLSGNSNAPKKYQDEFSKKHQMSLMLHNQVGEMTGEERVVAGGEREKELYNGNIDQMLAERMRRIEYFIARRRYTFADGSIDWERFDPDNKSEINPDTAKNDKERMEIYAFLDRMKKLEVYEKFDKEHIVTQKEDVYFVELQRWVGNILKNSKVGYDNQRGDLELPARVYKDFRQMREKLDPSAADFEDKLLKAVRDLKSEKFLDYFKGVDPNKRAMLDQYQYPTSLEATARLIAENKGAEWQTGGEHELVDAEGNFHRENFLLWMRKEINFLIDWDPISPINAQQGITFKAGFSQISLFDILYLPQYTRHQEFKMSGDVGSWYGEKKKGNFENGWGAPQEHPDMKYDVRVNAADNIGILEEAWDNDHEHKDFAMLNNPKAWSSVTEWVNARAEISGFNNYVRVGLAFKRYMLGSHKEGEVENYYKHGKQGSLGKAIAAGHLFFRYFSDFTEDYTKKGWDKEKNRENIIEVDRDNMAYQTLGHNGASYFMQSLAESAFDRVDNTVGKDGKGAREKIKGAYRDFIVKRAEKMKDDDVYKKLDGERKKNMEFLVENFVNDLKGKDLDKIKIRLDSYKELTDLKMDIESKVLGKRIVSAEDKKKYGWKDESVVVRGDVEKEISGKMRMNIGEDFFENVLKQQIPDVQEEKDGLKKKIEIDPITGKPKLVTIEGISVYTDANGRIVTKGEYMKIHKIESEEALKEFIKTNPLETVGGIVRNFVKHFEEDENKLAEYEEKFRPLYMKYEQAKKEYDLAVANESTDIAAKKQAMDERRVEFKEYDDILARNEGMGLALLTKVGNISRDELNMFKRGRTLGNTSTADTYIKGALKKSLSKVYGLDEEIEGTYAFHRVWYPLLYMGVAGFNNTSGLSGGIQPEAELSNFRKRRITKMTLGTAGGSKGTLDAFGALIPATFFEWTRVTKPGEGKPEHMLIDVLKGGEGRDIKPYFMRDLEDNVATKYQIKTESESAFHEDGLSKAEAVRKLIIEDAEQHLDKIVYTDVWGAQRIDHEKAIKIFGTWWDNIRMVFNNHEIDFESKVMVHGREMTMMEYMFGEEIRETRERMTSYYNKHAEKLDKKGKKDEADAYKSLATQLKNKPALAAFLFTVTTSMHEHREKWGTYDQWSVDTIQNIWVVLDEYLHGNSGLEWKGNDPKIKERPSMIPYELFDRLLGVHKSHSWLFGETEDSMEGHMFWDLFYCLVGGFVAGLTEARKEIEDELTGQPKKQWVG